MTLRALAAALGLALLSWAPALAEQAPEVQAGAPTAGAATAGAIVSGQVVDGASGLPLSDVRVQIQGTTSSALTDSEGRFTLTNVPAGEHVLTVSVVGYVLVRREIVVGQGGSIYLAIPLAEGTGTYTERVEVTGDLFRAGEPGVAAQQVLGSADLQNLRGLVLDDPVRALQVLPGVAATDDLYSEFSVRGSDFSHVGLAIDGVPSRFLSHTVQGVDEGGSIAMINSDILETVSLLSGSYPQRYGNRTGAQIDMTLREGSRDRTQARAALSGSSASLVTEGPIGHGRRASWLFSIRKSYLDLLVDKFSDYDRFAFGFTDAAAKIAVDLGAHQQLLFSGIAGRSKLKASQLEVGVNDPLMAVNRAYLGTAAWRYTPGPRLTWAVRLGVTGGNFNNRSLTRVTLDEGRSLDASLRTDATVVLSPALVAEVGASVHRQNEIVTQRRVVDPSAPPAVREDARLDSRWSGGYGQLRWTARGMGATGGARIDRWDALGGTTGSGWGSLQFRLPASVDATIGAGRYHQFPGFQAVAGLHGSSDLDAEQATQFDVGMSRRIGPFLRAQVTAYRREERGVTRLPGDEWQLVDGRPRPPLDDATYANRLDGTADGIELLVQRRSPNGLSGWVSYAFGHFRQRDVFTGERFDGDFDQRHGLNVYGLYRISDRTSLALKFRTSSNFPVRGYVEDAPPTAATPIPDDQPARYVLSEVRNSVRLPAYARLDLRANRTFTWQRSRITLFVEAMNVFDRTNWRTGNAGVRQDGELVGLLDALVPFVPSAGLLWEF